MRRWLQLSESRISMLVILLAFWATFWGLNGFDKFFNGTSAPNTAVTSGVVLDKDGGVLYRIHPPQPVGWYGVTRDPKFIAYFKTLHLPKEVAVAVLYTIGVVQILLCAVFIGLLACALVPRPTRLPDEHMVGRLAFKASVTVFWVFVVGDILFGDRMEVWEHGTYLILTFVSWQAWYGAGRSFPAAAVQRRGRSAAKKIPVPG